MLWASIIASGCTNFRASGASASLATKTGYYAFFLNNNLIVYGTSDNITASHVLVRNVFYVRTNVNPETKAVSSDIIKRGSEWHAPTEMLINADQIILIEPVGVDSRVHHLIKEAGTGKR